MVIASGSLVSHYRLIEKIGEGGMGVVWKALDTTLGRDVALKFLPDAVAADRDRVLRFEREARALAALNHPNIVTIHAVGEDQGIRFLAMELVAGRPLSSLVGPPGLDVGRVLDIAIPLASALSAAHEKGIVHRDLKPANIMVSDAGHVKVLDFGIARLRAATAHGGDEDETCAATLTGTAPGQAVGTPAYMSPEHVEGRAIDARSDIFAFGVVLYAMVTGELPFKGDNAIQMISSILRDVPAPVTSLRPDLPDEIARVVRRCLEKDPSRRYQSALDIANELEDLRERLQVEKAVGQTPARPRATGEPTAVPASASRRRAVTVAVAAGVLIVVALAVLGWSFRGRLFGSPGGGIRSLAVLPLANQMGDPGQDYLVDGLHDALITELARLGTVKVISRTSVMRFRKPDKPTPEIARALGVDAIVEGSVLRQGDRVRVNAQLIDGRTDSHVWARLYERNLRDVMGMMGEVTQAIAAQIKIAISPQHQARLAGTRPVRPEVQDLYLRGRQRLNEFTPPAIGEAGKFFQQAIDADPGYAPAYAGFAICNAYPGLFFGAVTTDLADKARAAATKAIELDEELGEAHAALGTVKFYFDWDWEGAGHELKRAVELNSADWVVYRPLSDYLLVIGDMDGAVAAARRGREVDPLSASNRAAVLSRLLWARRYDEAMTEARLFAKFIESTPTGSLSTIPHQVIALSLWATGRQSEAIAEFRAMWNNEGMNTLLDQGVAAGGPKEAMRRVANLMAANALKSGGGDPYTIAVYQALAGQYEQALSWLERACDDHNRDISHIRADASFDPLRAHPRFQAILDRLKFPK